MQSTVVSAWICDVKATPVPQAVKHSQSPSGASLSDPRRQHKRHRSVLAEHSPNVQRMPENPHKSKRVRRTPSPNKRAIDDVDVEGNDVDPINEQTPRAAQNIALRSTNAESAYIRALFEQPGKQNAVATPSVASSASNVSDAHSRSSSPVKKAAGLGNVGDGIYFAAVDDEGNELAGNSLGMDLFQRIEELRRGVGVVPKALVDDDDLRRRSGLRRIGDYQVDRRSNGRTREDILQELEALKYMVKESGRCTLENAQEPEWNSAVHGPILRSVLRSSGHVGVRYITASRIEPQWLPPHSTGSNVAGKLVDFAIVLELQHPAQPPLPATLSATTVAAEEPSTFATLAAKIRSLLGNSLSSINHTADPSLSHYPLAISIETKTAKRTEDEAKVQLAIWVAAHFTRLRALATELSASEPPLLASAADRATSLEKRVGLLSNLTLPLLYVTHTRWSIFYARPFPVPPDNALQNTRLYIYGPCDIGDTSTLLGLYSLKCVLSAIGKWVEQDFATWWREFVAE